MEPMAITQVPKAPRKTGREGKLTSDFHCMICEPWYIEKDGLLSSSIYTLANMNISTFLPSIWLIAALSLRVHSATTFGRISWKLTIRIYNGSFQVLHLHVQHESIERFFDMRFLLILILQLKTSFVEIFLEELNKYIP